jgi:23S rRNA (uracil1939-C5)-methyltransferase
MQTPETNEVRVEKLVYGGEGLSRVEGRVVLTPFVLPGEKAIVKPDRSKPELLRTRLVSVEEASEARVQPACEYFLRCGGCHYQHASYEYQLEQKKSILREVLQRVGKLEVDAIEVVSGEPWGYRNRSQFHLHNGKLGYLQAGSHTLVPITHCPISSPKLNESIAILREMMRDRRFPRFVRSIELFTNETEVQVNVLESDKPVARHFFDWCAERLPGGGAGSLDYAAAGHLFRASHHSFFQVNRFLLEKLVETALEGAEGDSATDLYAGVGLFSLELAKRFGNVTAVEATGSAIEDLQFNTVRAGAKLTPVKRSVEDYLAGLTAAPDFVLADPPRAGLGKRAVADLIRLKPRQITIVACDPATLARDLAPLVAVGYGIAKTTLVDLFPHTFHMETVVRLVLGSEG